MEQEELIDRLVMLIDERTDENERLRRELAYEKERSQRLKDSLDYARDQTLFSSRACPLCTYRGGIFIKRCNLHAEIDELRRRLGEKGDVHSD